MLEWHENNHDGLAESHVRPSGDHDRRWHGEHVQCALLLSTRFGLDVASPSYARVLHFIGDTPYGNLQLEDGIAKDGLTDVYDKIPMVHRPVSSICAVHPSLLGSVRGEDGEEREHHSRRSGRVRQAIVRTHGSRMERRKVRRRNRACHPDEQEGRSDRQRGRGIQKSRFRKNENRT